MTPIEHAATRVVALVTQHSILVTGDLHSGIDLARLLVSGEDIQLNLDVQARILLAHNTLQERYERLTLVASIFA